MDDQVSALEPGLYRATVRGVPDVIVMLFDTGMFSTMTAVGDHYYHKGSHVEDARPLVVLDLKWPAETASILRRSNFIDTALQIEAQTKPARIPEPEQGVRVEANLLGFPSWNEYLHFETLADEHWVRLKDGNVYTWGLLTNPQVVAS